MRSHVIALLALLALALAGSPAALADDSVGLPVISPPTLTAVPQGFTTDAAQAIAAAKSSPELQEFHRRVHPLGIQPTIWPGAHPYWFIALYHGGVFVAEVDVSPDGKVTGVWLGAQARAPYTHGNYSPLFDSPWVLVPFSLLFLAPFLARGRLWRLAHLDALVALSFLVSYELFDHGTLEPAVWLVYPPLLYLLGRMLWIGLRRAGPGGSVAGGSAAGGPGAGSLLARVDLRLLVAGLLALTAARVALSFANHQVIDVGIASVVGARRLEHGLPLYFASTGHGDTYGPIAYLAYLPFQLIFPWNGRFGYFAGAHVATAFFDLVTIGALVALGRRLRPGREGLSLGLRIAWVWAACPFTLLGIVMHTNDGLIAMLSVLGLLACASPWGRGALLGLAAAAKFSPAALLPLFATGLRLRARSAAVCVGAFVLVAAGSILAWLPPGGLREFYDHTLGYQLSRPDVFSPWALHPGLHPIAVALELLGGALVLAIGVWPRGQRDLRAVAALAAAATIVVQLPAVHWFYYYVAWFMPFLAVALLAPRVDLTAAAQPDRAGAVPERPPALSAV